jgi:hypothetical protein
MDNSNHVIPIGQGADGNGSPIISIDHSAGVENGGYCRWCENWTERRCPHCDKKWYCTPACAAKSVHHRFECAGRALTTADYLERAVLEDEIPVDPQTLEDYGFSRCETWNQKSHLLGLYSGLLNQMDVSSQNLDDWRGSGTLVENIISKYNEIPQGGRGSYFPWFIQNKHILESQPQAEPNKGDNLLDEILHKSKAALELEDQEKHVTELQPDEMRDAFFLYALTQEHIHPNPMGPGDLWYSFGFCTCVDEHEESRLGSLYGKLLGGNKFLTDYSVSLGEKSRSHSDIPMATFEEFWRAFQNGKLIQLMDQYGFQEERRRYPYLENFLAIRPAEPHPPVWRLCHFLAFEVTSLDIPPVAVVLAEDFGFSAGLSARMKLELRSFYKSLISKGGPLEFDEARSQGRLVDHAQRHFTKVDEAVLRILRELR